MKINKLSFFDKTKELSFENISFDKLTLLVGASGVGKTQILKSLIAIKNVALGNSINGIGWEIDFETITGLNYNWKGEYEDNGVFFFVEEDEEEELRKNKPKILFETLSIDGKEIINRNTTETYFNNQKTLKLAPEESILSILKEEDLIKPAIESFKKIIFSDQSQSQREPFKLRLFNVEKFLKQYNTLEKIQESDKDIRVKLFLVSKIDPKTFDKIKDRFCEIFPQVEDIKIAPLDNLTDNDVPSYIKDYPFIQMKEIGIKDWIVQGGFSSGMFRSLIHISEMYLCSEGTVFLIDEFENSLGINCIDELTNDILHSSRKIQFIITSHHPYIINNIHYSKWKLVTRKSGVIRTHNVDEFNIGKSKHDAFMQLMQLEEYQTGLEQ